MSMPRTHRRRSGGPALALALASAIAAGAALADGPNLGKPISPAEIAPWDISIMPDGTGLPDGSGTPTQGAAIFVQKCAVCHGENGKGGIAGPGAGGPAGRQPRWRQDDRQLLAVCHDSLRFCPSGDAVPAAEFTDQ